MATYDVLSRLEQYNTARRSIIGNFVSLELERIAVKFGWPSYFFSFFSFGSQLNKLEQALMRIQFINMAHKTWHLEDCKGDV